MKAKRTIATMELTEQDVSRNRFPGLRAAIYDSYGCYAIMVVMILMDVAVVMVVEPS